MLADTTALVIGKWGAGFASSTAATMWGAINPEDTSALFLGAAGGVSLVALILRLVFDGKQQAAHNKQTAEIIDYKDEIIAELREESKLKDVAIRDLREEVDDLRHWVKRD